MHFERGPYRGPKLRFNPFEVLDSFGSEDERSPLS
jgi:hypothetical protein